jgi:hypothetical protein
MVKVQLGAKGIIETDGMVRHHSKRMGATVAMSRARLL